MVRFSVALALFQILGTLNSIEAQAQATCTLECPIDAPCTFGNADFSDHPLDAFGTPIIIGIQTGRDTMESSDSPLNINGMHCDCPPLWTGVQCQTQFQRCNNMDDVCYNGGKCVASEFAKDGHGNTELLCDCSNAFAYDGTPYVGKFCEIPLSDACGRKPNGEEIFCANGGECNPNFLEGGVLPCDCDDGYEGLYCEFLIGTVPPCTMECQNGGVCVPGMANEQEAITLFQLWTADDTDDVKGEFNMRCACPMGLGGRHCEAPISEEGSFCGSYHCLNGGGCVTTSFTRDDGTIENDYHCDCTNAGVASGTRFGGAFCQFPASDFCTDENNVEETLQGHLFCVNEGTCKSEAATGCNCPNGFSGFKCDFRDLPAVTDNDNDGNTTRPVDEFVACGDHQCFYGGNCQTSMVEGIVTDMKCDCSEATTHTESFAGYNCQYKSTSFCEEADPVTGFLGKVFCVNDGKCKENPAHGCDCPTGYTGPHCEFTLFEDQGDEEDNIRPNLPPNDEDGGSNQESLVSTCHLQCLNGGICAQGAKDLGSLYNVVQDVDHLNDTFSEEFFEHCVCPYGWVGIFCDHKIEVCGDTVDHFCLHGSSCVASGSSDGQPTCDCSTADEHVNASSYSLFAGASCEHPANDICTVGEPSPFHPVHFCVNGGVCKNHHATVGDSHLAIDSADADNHPGCDCLDGWSGESCEIRTDALTMSKSPFTSGLVVIVLTIAGMSIVMIFVACCCRRVFGESDESMQRLCLRRRRGRGGGPGHDLQRGGSYRDHSLEQANFSTFREHPLEQANLSTFRFDRTRSPRHLADPTSGSDTDEGDDDEPRTFMPPRDEDDNDLCPVNII